MKLVDSQIVPKGPDKKRKRKRKGEKCRKRYREKENGEQSLKCLC